MIDLTRLRQLSARIGADRNLVQAGGGNTSLKDGDTLWVKASGKWLMHAEEEEMFLDVSIETALRCIDEGRDITEGSPLRPSVETTMHAVLPHRAVIHVHSVNTIAWAVRADAAARLAERLTGLSWQWIPYIHPGFPLARRIRELLDVRPDVLVLGNHGLVVGGDDCASAEALLHDVERRLDIPAAPIGEPKFDGFENYAGWGPAQIPEVHALGLNPAWCEVASGGTMYPDHCVYLGPAIPVVREGETVDQALAQYRERYDFDPIALLVAGKGVLVSDRMTRAGQELLICLKRVVERIQPGAQVNYLEDWQVAKLMNWDAEKYRIALARQHDRLVAR